MLNNNSINKTKYLNIIFLILILISIKDIIFKSEIYILEINENFNENNVNNLNQIFNERYNLDVITQRPDGEFTVPHETLKYFREKEDELIEKTSYKHLKTFLTDRVEFYKVISRYQYFGYDENIKYSFSNKIIDHHCNEFDDPNPSFYYISIKCAGLGPTHFSGNEFIKFSNNTKHGILVYDATRAKLGRFFYDELFNYLNAALSLNTSINGNGYKILEIVNQHDITLNVFFKKLTYIILFYLLSLFLIILFQERTKK